MHARLPQRRSDQRCDDQRDTGDLDWRQLLAEESGVAEIADLVVATGMLMAA